MSNWNGAVRAMSFWMVGPLLLGQIGCSGDGGRDATANHDEETGVSAAPLTGMPTWPSLDQWLHEQVDSGVIHGYSMQVFGANDGLLFQSSAGNCTSMPSCPAGNPAWNVNLVTGVASSSKWVTSTTVLSVLDEAVAAGRWSTLANALNAPINQSLNCGGPVVGTITMRQLLSFTSGIIPDHACVGKAISGSPPNVWTLHSCACAILQESEASMSVSCDEQHACLPGTTYRYAETHHTVAGAVVEEIASASWKDIFDAKVRDPLRLDMTYGDGTPNPNPNLAGSINASVADYAKFVRAVFHDGRDGRRRVLSPAAVDQQRRAQFPNADVLVSPQPGFQYGLNNWRWCLEPVDVSFLVNPALLQPEPSCDHLFSVGHGGKGGYMPWIDMRGDVYAVFAMREDSPGGGADYTQTEQLITTDVRTLVSLIVSAATP